MGKMMAKKSFEKKDKGDGKYKTEKRRKALNQSREKYYYILMSFLHK